MLANRREVPGGAHKAFTFSNETIKKLKIQRRLFLKLFKKLKDQDKQ